MSRRCGLFAAAVACLGACAVGPPPGPPGGACALPAYPDEDCTGVPDGTALRPVDGNRSIDAPNTVIDGLDIHGCVVVNAPGVIIRNTKIACEGSAVFNASYEGAGLLLEDVEITCSRQGGTGVSDRNYTARRAEVHGCENAFWAEEDVVIEDSYIHDLDESGTDPHTDGVQVPHNASDITIRHNAIHAYSGVDQRFGNSAITSPKTSDGGATNILITNNLLAGGSYTLYCQQSGTGTNFRVIDNHFSTVFSPTVGAFGPWLDCGDETQVSGNVIHETGQPLSGQSVS